MFGVLMSTTILVFEVDPEDARKHDLLRYLNSDTGCQIEVEDFGPMISARLIEVREIRS